MDAIDPELRDILGRSRELGLLGPGDIDAHLSHAEGFVRLLEEENRALDLGSGGGLPGLVVAMRLDQIRLTLLDANERRVAFLRDAVRFLELGERVDVVLGRAESLARRPELRGAFPVVVARSFGSPAVTAECAAGFLATSGRLLVSEPPGEEDRWPAGGLDELGLEPHSLHTYPHSRIRELRRTRDDLPHVPRKVGVPARRPLF